MPPFFNSAPEQLLGVRGLAAQAGAPSHIFVRTPHAQGPPTSSARPGQPRGSFAAHQRPPANPVRVATASGYVGNNYSQRLPPSFNHHRSARKIRRQAQNAVLPRLDLLAVDPRDPHWATAADFEPEAPLPKPQVRLNRRAARIQRWRMARAPCSKFTPR